MTGTFVRSEVPFWKSEINVVFTVSAVRCVRSCCFRLPKGALILLGYSRFRTREGPKPATPYNNARLECNLRV